MQVRTAETNSRSSGRRRIRLRAKSAGRGEEPARQVAARSRPWATLTAFTSAGFVLFVVGTCLLLLARIPTMSKVRLATGAACPHIIPERSRGDDMIARGARNGARELLERHER
jgi:hypothetical protein